jgi:hypothetical protein
MIQKPIIFNNNNNDKLTKFNDVVLFLIYSLTVGQIKFVREPPFGDP